MEAFQCRLCPSLFETYAHAATHLRTTHSVSVRASRNRGSICHEQLTPIEFRLVNIPLSRVDDVGVADKSTRGENGYQSATESAPPKTPAFKRPQQKPRGSQRTVQKTKGGGVEIKLDSLKASEIETLMRDLYQGQRQPKQSSKQSSNSSGPLIFPNLSQKSHQRRAAATVADQVLNSIGQEENAQQEKDDGEEPYHVRRKRSAKKYEDGDYRPYFDGGDDTQKKTRRTNKPRRKSSKFSEDEGGDDVDDDNIVSDANDGKTPAKYRCRVCDNLEFGRNQYVEHMKKEHFVEDAYPCSHCDTKFPSILKFNQHWDRIKVPRKKRIYEKRFECDVCSRKFRFFGELEKHQAIHERRKNDPTKTVKCPLCKFNFARINSMQRHFVLHLENNPFICKLTGCGAKFGNAEHLARHVKLHSGLKPYACESCDRTFARVDSLQKHVNKIHIGSNKGRKNRRFRRREKFPTFVKSINELAPDTYLGLNPPTTGAPNYLPSLNVIPKPEPELDEIRWELESQHFTDHVTANPENEEKITDVILGEVLSATVSASGSKDDPKSEEMSNSNSNDDSYNPDEDETETSQPEQTTNSAVSEFRSSNYSIRSIILRDPVYQKLLQEDPVAAESVLPQTHGYCKGYFVYRQTFPCTICDWSSARAFFLQKHMKTRHNIDMNLMSNKNTNPETGNDSEAASTSVVLHCGSCGYQSTSAAELSSHIRKEHEPIPKFTCPTCGIKFNSMQKKILHEKNLHMTKRKYPCAKCPSKSFANKAALRDHCFKRHIPKTPARLERSKCKTCGKQLACMLSLKAHMLIHTDEMRVSCQICGQSCANKLSLKRHIAYVHLNVRNPYNRSLKKKIVTPTEQSGDQVGSAAATLNSNSEDNTKAISSQNHELNGVEASSTGEEMIVGL